MLCLSGFGKAFCFESHSERIGADGREILFVLFLDIPIESLRLLSFFPPSPNSCMFSFLSSFLSPFLLENFFFFFFKYILIIQHPLKAMCVSDKLNCGHLLTVSLHSEKVARGAASS